MSPFCDITDMKLNVVTITKLMEFEIGGYLRKTKIKRYFQGQKLEVESVYKSFGLNDYALTRMDITNDWINSFRCGFICFMFGATHHCMFQFITSVCQF